MKRFFLLMVAICAFVLTATAAVDGISTITPTQLTCEYDTDPVIDIQNPRFTWVNQNTAQKQGAAQTAYRIRVATSPDDFSLTVWDTGKVHSSGSAFITYKGQPLKSRTSYWWQVMVWDEQGRASEWSAPARWHMGLLSKDEWQGRWIGAPWQGEESYDMMKSKDVVPAPLLRKEFSVSKKVKEARFYGTGLGYFELYINGERVGEDYLSPNQTNYTTRPELNTRDIVVEDPFEEYLVMYLTHEVENLLVEGENAVGVILGNGFYDMVRHWPAMGYGTPRFMGQIEILYEDGSREIIASDTSWKAERSAITSDQIFFGEHYDARLEHKGWATAAYDDSAWQAAVEKKAPIGTLVPQNGPADRITKRYAPVEFEKKEDYIRIKFPEEISGWLALKNIKAEKGQKIDIKYVSESPGNGTNSYIASGSGDESYHARFTWFVFSEVEVRGIDNLTAEQVEAHAVNSDVDYAGEFKTSNDLINTINKIWRRSQLDNMHGAIASDCPHRERSPYTGDGQVACVTVMHNFDAQTFYNKWLRDIRGSQTSGGYVPNGAPWQPGCGGGVGWGAAMEIMPWEFYVHYGDRRVLEQNFDAMRRHVRWMTTWVDSDTGLMLS
ncbi:MAG: alpha-L-rhamnosidase N-terminal domain-containing protein, partial [Alistipes sp.]|nr:alpha-L-rhamnosidase N-terminal domain-containing protein [Alistipes sp.]